MAKDVSAIVGPHGGQWYNIWWAARGTLLLEFMPLSRPALMFWAEGSLLGLRYWVIPVDTAPPKHDMEVDPAQVAAILRQQLGQAAAPDDGPQPYYHWGPLSLLT